MDPLKDTPQTEFDHFVYREFNDDCTSQQFQDWLNMMHGLGFAIHTFWLAGHWQMILMEKSS